MTEKKERWYEKINVFFIVVFFVLLISSGAIIGRCSTSKRKDSGGSEYSGRYSEQDERAREALGRIGEGLGELEERLGELKRGYELDAEDIRGIVTALRQTGAEVKDLEDIVMELRGYLSGFIDYYYDSLDAEIERELGIKLK